MELSGLELPDITMGSVASAVKGLSRKRPRRSLNVTAFENRLKDGTDVEENEELSSSISLSLKTPFMDIRTERKGLQRRISNRRKISEEEFGAAVNKRQMGNDHGVTSFVSAEQGLSDSVHSEGFTLGLSKISLPDITTDIVNCNTALYAQTDAVTSSTLTLATPDKPMVMASQLQSEMEQSQLEREKSVHVFPIEEGIVTDSPKECVSTMSESKEEVLADDCQPEDAEVVFTSEEYKGMKKSQTSENDGPADSEQEENAAEEGDSQTEEDAAARSQSEEDVFVGDSQTEEEGAVGSQSEEDDAANSQSKKEEDAENDQEVPVISSEEVDGANDFQSKDNGDVRQEKEDEDQGSKQLEGNLEYIRGRAHRSEGGLGGNLEYISRRAHRSEGGLIIRVVGTEGVQPDSTETGMPDDNSKVHGANHSHGNTDVGSGEISHGMTEIDKSSSRNDDSGAETDSTKGITAQDPEEEEEEEEEQGEGEEEVVEEEDEKDEEEQMLEEKGKEEEEEEKEGEEEMVEETEEDEVGEDEEEEMLEEQGEVDGEDGEKEVVEAVVDGEEEMEEEEEDEENEDIPMKTPAVVKQKMNFPCPDPLVSPVLKTVQSNRISGGGLPGAKPKPGTRRRTGAAKKQPVLPKSYLMAVFKHFAKTKVSADVYPVLQDITDKYFDQLAKDLEAYALHARRKTIEVEDAELLLKRQGYVNDKMPVEVLIEKYLGMDQRKLLIPIATSGNVVIPKRRR